MIVYNRQINESGIQNLHKDEELIYYYDNNIAYTINQTADNFVVRRKKIFNNQLMEEFFAKTIKQVIKKVG